MTDPEIDAELAADAPDAYDPNRVLPESTDADRASVDRIGERVGGHSYESACAHLQEQIRQTREIRARERQS